MKRSMPNSMSCVVDVEPVHVYIRLRPIDNTTDIHTGNKIVECKGDDKTISLYPPKFKNGINMHTYT